MAVNKADEALNNNHISDNTFLTKVYYCGPGEGSTVVNIPELDDEHTPVVFKWYLPDGACRQFLDAGHLYTVIGKELGMILDIAVVNTKQRDALAIMINKFLYETLLKDHTGDMDTIDHTN